MIEQHDLPVVPQPLTTAVTPVEPARHPTDDDQTITKQRELIQQLIKQELKENSKPYEGKSSAELDSLFQKLLVAKLRRSATHTY